VLGEIRDHTKLRIIRRLRKEECVIYHVEFVFILVVLCLSDRLRVLSSWIIVAKLLL